MAGECNGYGEEERCIKWFGGEAWSKETTWSHRHRWDDSIQMDLQEMGWGGA
jgi:hypothetical protein